jgi:1-acyl-sn-glycerol-3-phosphate acyltransferase
MRMIIDVPRTLVCVVAGVVATVLAVAVIVVTAPFNDRSPIIDRVIRVWSHIWLATSGTTLKVEGASNLDPARSYVVVANHQSALDIMTCLLAVPIPIRFLAKKELFRIPILAQGMRTVGIVEVDREARGAIHAQVNQQAKDLIANGRSLIIYPEGTRPRTGALGPFKKGAFTMAIAGQLPILPLTIHGSYEAWPPGQPWIHGGEITAVIDKPIETAGLTHADTGDLRDQVFELISGRVRTQGGRIGV